MKMSTEKLKDVKIITNVYYCRSLDALRLNFLSKGDNKCLLL